MTNWSKETAKAKSPAVTIPGASFAHALHQSGIPRVVASQFPLSVEGSVPLANALYKGLLWGEHPLVSVQRLARVSGSSSTRVQVAAASTKSTRRRRPRLRC